MRSTGTYDTLLVEQKDSFATVTLNRPQSLNALNALMFDELAIAFRELIEDHAVRAIVVTGAGEKAFAGGADIRELSRAGRLQGQQLSRRAQAVFREIEKCGKPVIACINGYALGGGCELAMACTFRIASDTARFGQPEIKLGLLPGYGGTQRLPRLVGRSAALRMILTGEMISATEALRLRLVDEVVPAADLLAHGYQLAATLAAMPPIALEACMDAVLASMEMPFDRGLDLETQLFGHLCGTADKQEGTEAFLEKRTPRWTGR